VGTAHGRSPEVRWPQWSYCSRPQHTPAACTGGHGTLPYEQKMQQCPGSGRCSAPHDAHWWK